MSINKKIKNATVNTYNTIEFKSKLESRAYQLFTEAGLNPKYEVEKLVLMEGFKPTIPFYTRNKAKQLVNNDKKIINITYTPDFLIEYNGYKFYIEMKGFINDSYPLKKKLFRKLIESKTNIVFFELYTVRDINKAIEIIKSYKNDGQ